MKLMGKRQIGELEINELVSTLLVSEIAAMPITEPDIPMLNAIIPILFIVSAEILISYLKNKSSKVKKIIEGSPSYLIYKGRINEAVLLENRLSVNELLCEMRMQSIFDIKEVDYAILEQCGDISFFKNESHSKMAHYLIIDGVADEKLLSTLNISKKELFKGISDAKLDVRDILLLSVNEAGNFDIIRKGEK
jgi:uncharacterized membrane protein YcaP (DUF421 family)